MSEVTVRDLRNHGGEVLDRVLAGERITVTRRGTPIVDLVIHRPPATPVDVLLEHYRNVPLINYRQLQRDMDEILDPRL